MAWNWTVAIQGIRLRVIDTELEAAGALLGSVRQDERGSEWPPAASILLAVVICALTGIPHPIGRSREAEEQPASRSGKPGRNRT